MSSSANDTRENIVKIDHNNTDAKIGNIASLIRSIDSITMSNTNTDNKLSNGKGYPTLFDDRDPNALNVDVKKLVGGKDYSDMAQNVDKLCNMVIMSSTKKADINLVIKALNNTMNERYVRNLNANDKANLLHIIADVLGVLTLDIAGYTVDKDIYLDSSGFHKDRPKPIRPPTEAVSTTTDTAAQSDQKPRQSERHEMSLISIMQTVEKCVQYYIHRKQNKQRVIKSKKHNENICIVEIWKTNAMKNYIRILLDYLGRVKENIEILEKINDSKHIEELVELKKQASKIKEKIGTTYLHLFSLVLEILANNPGAENMAGLTDVGQIYVNGRYDPAVMSMLTNIIEKTDLSMRFHQHVGKMLEPTTKYEDLKRDTSFLRYTTLASTLLRSVAFGINILPPTISIIPNEKWLAQIKFNAGFNLIRMISSVLQAWAVNIGFESKINQQKDKNIALVLNMIGIANKYRIKYDAVESIYRDIKDYIEQYQSNAKLFVVDYADLKQFNSDRIKVYDKMLSLMDELMALNHIFIDASAHIYRDLSEEGNHER